MVRALAPVADTVIVTQPPLEQRQGDTSALVGLFEQHLPPNAVTRLDAAPAALDGAMAGARPGDTIVVTGSMFLIGAVRNRWVPEEQILCTRSSALVPNP
jgi:folylpolyglutamate synthase/dihydropteroate synthase